MQVEHWRSIANEATAQLDATRRSNEELQLVAVPQLREENERAKQVIDSVQAELSTARTAHSESHRQMAEKLASLTEELQRFTADNHVLRGELAKTVHSRQTTNTKLDLIRKKLGLTDSEAKVFVQVGGPRCIPIIDGCLAPPHIGLTLPCACRFLRVAAEAGSMAMQVAARWPLWFVHA